MSPFGFFKPDIETMTSDRNIDGLRKALQHRDPAIRSGAVRALMYLNDPYVIPWAKALLHSGYTDTVYSAAMWLGAYKVPEAVPTLGEILMFGPIGQRKRSATLLGNIGTIDAIAALVKAYDHPTIQGDEMKSHILGAIRATGRSGIISVYVERLMRRDKEAARALELLGWQPGKDKAGAMFWLVKGDLKKCAEIGAPAADMLAKLADELNGRLKALTKEWHDLDSVDITVPTADEYLSGRTYSPQGKRIRNEEKMEACRKQRDECLIDLQNASAALAILKSNGVKD